jgi:hypothetical protein
MAISMYQASVPVFVRALRNLAHVLDKGAAHARDRGDDPDALLALRMAEDMLPLSRQVQIATDMAKNGAARLAGADPMKVPDEETTMDALQARILRVVDYVKGFGADQVDGSEDRRIVVPTSAAGELVMTGQEYLLGFVLPNLYFHSTMTYALLRREGVPLGKMDFMAGGRRP